MRVIAKVSFATKWPKQRVFKRKIFLEKNNDLPLPSPHNAPFEPEVLVGQQ